MIGFRKTRRKRGDRGVLNPQGIGRCSSGREAALDRRTVADKDNLGKPFPGGAQSPFDDARVFPFGKHDAARPGLRGFEDTVERFHQACPR
jgi:hypothetical protein